MTFSIDFLSDGRVLEWERDGADARASEHTAYTPRFFVGTRTGGMDTEFGPLREFYEQHPHVRNTEFVNHRPGFRRGQERLLAVDVSHVERVASVARQARQLPQYPIGELACFNVDFSREFRYCLEEDVDPTPTEELSTLRLAVPLPETSGETYGELSIDGETISGYPERILDCVLETLDDRDPDVLVLSTSDIIPTLHQMADQVGRDVFSMSRVDDEDYQQLAGRSTFASYGQVGHSPARYNVPGRVIVDESNTFFYDESNLSGILDLVERSHKPLQEASWASIGNILTAIQIREARERDVLVPWRSWRHEFQKSMGTLHDADRGGFIFAPEVGLHEDVHELDFSSLYPNIICTRNVSPDTIRCDCHSEREDVPELGYAICDEAGYLPDVLQPIIDDRDEYKAAIRAEKDREAPDTERIKSLEGRSSALKWILVSCFGYQGFSNAKFGRIECHEAINAYARKILLDAKTRLEAGGWEVVHGIVDSIWVTPDSEVPDEKRESLEQIAAALTESIGIRLEYESAYEWVCFVPLRDSEAGALTKYFGKAREEDEFKVRGIEARQRSTPPFIEQVQRECIEVLDETRSPEAVLERVAAAISELYAGTVAPTELVETNRISKTLETYTQNTKNVAALQRARDQCLSIHPGQSIEYVVVDDAKNSRERVTLAHEELDEYDAAYYETQLVRAIESVLSPLGWDRTDIEVAFSDNQMVALSSFTEEM